MTASAIQIEGRRVTFDGYDGNQLACKRINVWRDYENRAKGAICTVRHGTPAELLERKGEACKVRVNWEGRAQEGWVTFWFIAELKTDWQIKRLAEGAG